MMFLCLISSYAFYLTQLSIFWGKGILHFIYVYTEEVTGKKLIQL